VQSGWAATSAFSSMKHWPRRHPSAALVLCGAVSALIYLAAFTLPYGLAVGIEKPLQHFGHLSGPSVTGTASFIGAICLLLVLYLGALSLCHHLEGSRQALITLYLLGALCALVLIPMYPAFSLDVFYYMAADRIWTVFHENPFVVPPLQAAHDAFFPYTRWGHYPLPYGPLWPWITAGTSSFAHGELLPTLLSFKILGAIGYVACLPAVTWAARGLRQPHPLLSTATFALNPLVLIELAGVAHNEALALLPVALAVGFWARGAGASAALAVASSLLVKATAIVAVPALLLPNAQRAAEQRSLPRWVVTHVAPAIVLFGLAWLPFWQGGAITGPLREAGQYYQSLSAVIAGAFPPARNPNLIRIVQVVLFLVFAAAYLSQRKTLAQEGRPALTAIWGLTVFYFLAVTPFLSAWYMLWPVLYAAILGERRVTQLTTLLCVGAFATYVMQFVVRPTLNLGGMETSAVGLALISAPFLIGLLVTSLRDQRRLSGAAALARATVEVR
jgi:alpha-1,6-mannosyltransferase